MSGTIQMSTTLVVGSSPDYLFAALQASPALRVSDVRLALLCKLNGCKQQQVPYEGCSIGTLASLRRDNIRHSWRALLAPFGAPEPSPAAAACAASGAAPASALAFPQSEELQVDNLVVVWPECTSCTTMLGNTCLGASGSPAAQPGPSLSTCCAECSPNSALAQQQQELLQLLTPIVEQQRQQGQEEQEEECAATAGLIALAADLASGADQYTPQQLQAIHTLPSLPHSKLPGVSYLCIQAPKPDAPGGLPTLPNDHNHQQHSTNDKGAPAATGGAAAVTITATTAADAAKPAAKQPGCWLPLLRRLVRGKSKAKKCSAEATAYCSADPQGPAASALTDSHPHSSAAASSRQLGPCVAAGAGPASPLAQSAPAASKHSSTSTYPATPVAGRARLGSPLLTGPTTPERTVESLHNAGRGSVASVPAAELCGYTLADADAFTSALLAAGRTTSDGRTASRGGSSEQGAAAHVRGADASSAVELPTHAQRAGEVIPAAPAAEDSPAAAAAATAAAPHDAAQPYLMGSPPPSVKVGPSVAGSLSSSLPACAVSPLLPSPTPTTGPGSSTPAAPPRRTLLARQLQQQNQPTTSGSTIPTSASHTPAAPTTTNPANAAATAAPVASSGPTAAPDPAPAASATDAPRKPPAAPRRGPRRSLSVSDLAPPNSRFALHQSVNMFSNAAFATQAPLSPRSPNGTPQSPVMRPARFSVLGASGGSGGGGGDSGSGRNHQSVVGVTNAGSLTGPTGAAGMTPIAKGPASGVDAPIKPLAAASTQRRGPRRSISVSGAIGSPNSRFAPSQPASIFGNTSTAAPLSPSSTSGMPRPPASRLSRFSLWGAGSGGGGSGRNTSALDAGLTADNRRSDTWGLFAGALTGLTAGSGTAPTVVSSNGGADVPTSKPPAAPSTQRRGPRRSLSVSDLAPPTNRLARRQPASIFGPTAAAAAAGGGSRSPAGVGPSRFSLWGSGASGQHASGGGAFMRTLSTLDAALPGRNRRGSEAGGVLAAHAIDGGSGGAAFLGAPPDDAVGALSWQLSALRLHLQDPSAFTFPSAHELQASSPSRATPTPSGGGLREQWSGGFSTSGPLARCSTGGVAAAGQPPLNRGSSCGVGSGSGRAGNLSPAYDVSATALPPPPSPVRLPSTAAVSPSLLSSLPDISALVLGSPMSPSAAVAAATASSPSPTAAGAAAAGTATATATAATPTRRKPPPRSASRFTLQSFGTSGHLDEVAEEASDDEEDRPTAATVASTVTAAAAAAGAASPLLSSRLSAHGNGARSGVLKDLFRPAAAAAPGAKDVSSGSAASFGGAFGSSGGSSGGGGGRALAGRRAPPRARASTSALGSLLLAAGDAASVPYRKQSSFRTVDLGARLGAGGGAGVSTGLPTVTPLAQVAGEDRPSVSVPLQITLTKHESGIERSSQGLASVMGAPATGEVLLMSSLGIDGAVLDPSDTMYGEEYNACLVVIGGSNEPQEGVTATCRESAGGVRSPHASGGFAAAAAAAGAASVDGTVVHQLRFTAESRGSTGSAHGPGTLGHSVTSPFATCASPSPPVQSCPINALLLPDSPNQIAPHAASAAAAPTVPGGRRRHPPTSTCSASSLQPRLLATGSTSRLGLHRRSDHMGAQPGSSGAVDVVRLTAAANAAAAAASMAAARLPGPPSPARVIRQAAEARQDTLVRELSSWLREALAARREVERSSAGTTVAHSADGFAGWSMGNAADGDLDLDS